MADDPAPGSAAAVAPGGSDASTAGRCLLLISSRSVVRWIKALTCYLICVPMYLWRLIGDPAPGLVFGSLAKSIRRARQGFCGMSLN